MHNVCLFERSRVNLNVVRSAFGMAETAMFMTTLVGVSCCDRKSTHIESMWLSLSHTFGIVLSRYFGSSVSCKRLWGHLNGINNALNQILHLSAIDCCPSQN